MNKDHDLGLAEAAARLRIPYQDAHRLVLTGTLPGEKRGGRWYVRLSDVDELARQRSVGAGGCQGEKR